MNDDVIESLLNQHA